MKQQQIQDYYQGEDVIYEDPDQEHQGTLNSFVEVSKNGSQRKFNGGIFALPKSNKIVKAAEGKVAVDSLDLEMNPEVSLSAVYSSATSNYYKTSTNKSQ